MSHRHLTVVIVHFVDVSKMLHPISAGEREERERETVGAMQLGGIPRDWFQLEGRPRPSVCRTKMKIADRFVWPHSSYQIIVRHFFAS